MKKLIILSFLLLSCFLFGLFLCNLIVEKNAEGKLYTSTKEIPKNKVGVVLGTAKLLNNGTENLYFTYRINATVELFNANKIEYILISGDNGKLEYDEPTDFKEELIRRGIPEDRIFLDFAGFRTLDSVVRAKKIFGQDRLIFISQKFHNERAVFIAKYNNINAIGFNAKDVSGRYGIKVKLREYLARVKVMIDVVFNVQPKFLGKKIEIK